MQVIVGVSGGILPQENFDIYNVMPSDHFWRLNCYTNSSEHTPLAAVKLFLCFIAEQSAPCCKRD